MRAQVVVFIALLASSGCGGSDDPPTTTPRSDRTSAPTTSTPTVRPRGAEGPPGPEATPESQALPVVTLGRQVVATPPSQSARAAQERAERAEAAGDLEAALGAWRDALVETPDFDAAHFELARLLASQGAEDEAENEVRVALLHDVGRFLVRFREDPAFARLRERAALQTFVRALESAFAQAVAEGMPLIEARTVLTSPAPYDVMLGDAETFEARGALWVQAWHRFVLASPPRRQARWAHVDRERRRTVVVSSAYDTMPDVGYYLAHARIDVYALEPAVAPIASWAAGPTWMVRLDLERPNLGVCVTDLWSGEDSCRELPPGEARTIASDALSLDLDVSIRGEIPSTRPRGGRARSRGGGEPRHAERIDRAWADAGGPPRKRGAPVG
jgi:tetratricopeptide (TPR) repeat protein